MNRLASSRGVSRLCAIGLGSAGGVVLSRSTIRFDSKPPLKQPSSRVQRPASSLSPQLIRQVSSGSITGFIGGFLVALFSRVLVILTSITAASLYMALRAGIEPPGFRNFKSWVEKSAVWKRALDKPWYAASFGLTFLLSAFVRL